MSYHERMRMMHERMTIRNLDIENFIDTCVICVENMENKLDFWTEKRMVANFHSWSNVSLVTCFMN